MEKQELRADELAYHTPNTMEAAMINRFILDEVLPITPLATPRQLKDAVLAKFGIRLTDNTFGGI